MSIDHVVDGSPYDADQPGHNPVLKPDFWPQNFAVHLPGRDGQTLPIGAVYQGVVDGQHLYALLTTSNDPVNMTEITSLVNPDNSITLTYVDKNGSTQVLTTPAVNSAELVVDNTAKTLKTIVNGVESAAIDISALYVDIHVEDGSLAWDPDTYFLSFKETDGTEFNINLGSLVAVSVTNSITGDGTNANPLKLVGDQETPDANSVYGTSPSGAKGWKPVLSPDARNTATVDSSGGVLVLQEIGDVQTTVVTSAVDIPLVTFGNLDKNLYFPTSFKILLDPKTGTPLLDGSGNRQIIPVYSIDSTNNFVA